MNATSTRTHGIDMKALGRSNKGLHIEQETICIETKKLNLFYGEKQALTDINIVLPEKRVSAFIGPSGCGKSTLLRCLNRMNDLVDICRIEGNVVINGRDIYERSVDVADLRRKVGMVFQKPNPFPKSIYENVAYGLRLQGIDRKSTRLNSSHGYTSYGVFGLKS